MKKTQKKVTLRARSPARSKSPGRPRKAASATRKARSAPSAVGVSASAQPRNHVSVFTRDSEVVSFCELLASGVVTGTVGSTVILNVTLGMASFRGTRLAVMSQLWEKFRFRSLRIKVVSSVPTSAGGNAIVSWDADPVDSVPPNTTGGMQQLTAQENSKIFALWEGADLPLNLRSLPDVGFFTNAGQNNQSATDPRLYQQGQVFIAILNAPATTQTFSLMIEGECEFFARNFSPLADPTEIANPAGYGIPSVTSGTAWNLLQGFVNGTAGVIEPFNGLNLTSPTINGDGTVGMQFPSGIYEVLYGAQNVATPVLGASIVARTVDPPGVRTPSSIIQDPYFQNVFAGNAADPEDVYTRLRLTVADVLGTALQFGVLNAGGTTGNLIGAAALYVRRISN